MARIGSGWEEGVWSGGAVFVVRGGDQEDGLGDESG